MHNLTANNYFPRITWQIHSFTWEDLIIVQSSVQSSVQTSRLQMETVEVNHFLNVIKYLMILTGQWNYRNKKSRSIAVYGKIKYSLLCCYIFSAIVFCVSIFPHWKCRSNVIENFFNFMHLVVVITVTVMLKSQDTKKIINFIHHFENVQLESAGDESRRIYMKISKKNNQIVSFFTSVAVFASVSWFFTGRR